MHFDPKRAIESIAQHKVTMTSLPGAILGIIADHPEVKKLSSLRTIIYGGAPTPMGVLRKAAAALPPALSHAYGITETAGYVTNLKPADHIFEGSEEDLARTASAGQATPLIDVRVVDDDGRPLAGGRSRRSRVRRTEDHGGLLAQARSERRGAEERLVSHRRHGRPRRARLPLRSSTARRT